MDIFSNNELRKEETFGGFASSSESDESFMLNKQNKYPGELNTVEIKPEAYKVFTKEDNTQTETSPDNEPLQVSSASDSEAWDDLFSTNTNQEADIPAQANKEEFTTENSEKGGLEDILNTAKQSKSGEELAETEPTEQKEFEDIDKSPEAQEIDIDNLFPEHPSHYGIDSKSKENENEETAQAATVAGKKEKKKKAEKPAKQKIEKNTEQSEEDKNKRKSTIKKVVAIAAVIVLIMLLGLADMKYNVVRNLFTPAHKDTTAALNKESVKKSAVENKAKPSDELSKKDDTAKAKDSLENIKNQKIQDSIKFASNKKIQDSIKLAEKSRKQDSIKAEIAAKAAAEKEKLAQKRRIDSTNNAARLKAMQDKAKSEAARPVAQDKKKSTENKKKIAQNNQAKETSIAKENLKPAKPNAEAAKKEKNNNYQASSSKSADNKANDKLKQNKIKDNSSNDEEYVIQIYATPSKEDADNWLSKVRRKVGNQATISTQMIRDVKWYRIRFGKFKTRRDAELAAQQSGFTQSWIDRTK